LDNKAALQFFILSRSWSQQTTCIILGCWD